MTYQVYQLNEYKRWEINQEEQSRLFSDIISNMEGWSFNKDCYENFISNKQYELKLYVETHPNNTEVKSPKIKISLCGRLLGVYGMSNIWNHLGTQETNAYTTSINVSISRGAMVIADQIKKRLLPDYVVLYAKAYQRYLDKHIAENERKRITWQLASVIDARPHTNYDGCSIYEYINVGGKSSLSVEVRVNSSNSDFKISSVPTEMAAEILEVINKYSEESVYYRWRKKAEKTVLYQLNKGMGLKNTDDELLELPTNSFDWRNAYLSNTSEHEIYQLFSKSLNESLVTA